MCHFNEFRNNLGLASPANTAHILANGAVTVATTIAEREKTPTPKKLEMIEEEPSEHKQVLNAKDLDSNHKEDLNQINPSTELLSDVEIIGENHSE